MRDLKDRARERRRTIVMTIVTVAAASAFAAAIFLYALYDPSASRFYPKCPFHLLTGLECPGCGSQRAVHCLLTGDLPGALHYNFLVTAAIPYILLYAVICLILRTPGKAGLKRLASRLDLVLYHGHAVRVILVLVLVFWLARNFTPAF